VVRVGYGHGVTETCGLHQESQRVVKASLDTESLVSFRKLNRQPTRSLAFGMASRSLDSGLLFEVVYITFRKCPISALRTRHSSL
jgi:hypothetical protein